MDIKKLLPEDIKIDAQKIAEQALAKLPLGAEPLCFARTVNGCSLGYILPPIDSEMVPICELPSGETLELCYRWSI